MKLDTLKGIAIGVAIAYLFDPDRGRARRADVAAGLAAATRSVLGRPGRPVKWEAPMLTIQIDVDDRQAWDRHEPPDTTEANRPRIWPQKRRGPVAPHPGHPSA